VSVDLPARSHATSLLRSATASTAGGDGAAEGLPADAVDRLVPLIYDELRVMAHRHIARERRDATLQTTELVHEAYLRLVDETQVTRRGRAYFFAAAAQAMRRVLVDRARRRSAAKRGGPPPLGAAAPIDVEETGGAIDAFAAELLDLDAALERLAALDPRQARVVECRYFAGLSVEETAEALGVSPRTVKSDWAVARAWLYAALRTPGAG
jgi:RNA polymerase sigma factor (TIGR02999 family)